MNDAARTAPCPVTMAAFHAALAAKLEEEGEHELAELARKREDEELARGFEEATSLEGAELATFNVRGRGIAGKLRASSHRDAARKAAAASSVTEERILVWRRGRERMDQGQSVALA